MSELVDASTWQYAVIAIRTQPRREQLVLASPDEKTLRVVIAALSIIALGYGSRDQAVTDIDRCIPMIVASQRRSTAELVSTNRKSLEEARAAKRRSADRYDLAWTRSFFGHVLQQGVAAAIVFLYSRSLVHNSSFFCLVLGQRRDTRFFGTQGRNQSFRLDSSGLIASVSRIGIDNNAHTLSKRECRACLLGRHCTLAGPQQRRTASTQSVTSR